MKTNTASVLNFHKICAVVLFALSAALLLYSQSSLAGGPDKSTFFLWDVPKIVGPVHFGDLEPVLNSQSQLTRTSKGISLKMHTSGLTPGHVVSVWYMLINKPSECTFTPCDLFDFNFMSDVEGIPTGASFMSAGGEVIGTNGSLTKEHFLPVNNPAGSEMGFGLTDPKNAYIWIALVDHGVALDGVHGDDLPYYFRRQLTTPLGACINDDIDQSLHQPAPPADQCFSADPTVQFSIHDPNE
ncbi:MAG TPA: hypothetical protein VI522_06550 [Gammaproteobacteria bacterium]|nr:hypothetical protein [Gammaproteobacteria bacterium]